MQRQSLKTPRIEIWRIFLLMILVFGGCSGCGQKTVPEVPVDPPEAVRQPESSDFQRRAAQLLREKRSADIELPAVPPDYYYGDILYWIPSVETRGCSCHDSPKKMIFFTVKYSRSRVKCHATSAFLKILTSVKKYSKKTKTE